MTWDLADPRMQYQHRLGLANLALTCRHLQDEGRLASDDWELARTTLTVKNDWKATLTDAYRETFRLEDGVFHTPAFYRKGHEPDRVVRVQVQGMLRNTVVRCPKDVIQIDKDDLRREAHDYDGRRVSVTYKPVVRFRQLEKRLSTYFEEGSFLDPVEFSRNDLPGVMQTHASMGRYRPKTTKDLRFLLDMSHLGVIPIQHGAETAAVYLQVEDLRSYVEHRPLLTPRGFKDLFRSGIEEAVFVYLRLFDHGYRDVRGCVVSTFGRPAWEKSNTVVDVRRVDFASIDDDQRRMLRLVVQSFPNAYAASRNGESYVASSRIRPISVANVLAKRTWSNGLYRVFREHGELKSFSAADAEGIRLLLANTPATFESRLVKALHTVMRHYFGGIGANSTDFGGKVGRLKQRWGYRLRRIRNIEGMKQFLFGEVLAGASESTLREFESVQDEIFACEDHTRIRDAFVMALVTY